MRTIVVANCKGGVGRSFLAANLGFALAEAETKALLVDLDPEVPVLDLYWPQSVARFGPESAKQAWKAVEVGDRLSLCPWTATGSATPVDDALEGLNLTTISPSSDAVVADLGPGMTALGRASLSQADDVLLVLTPDPASHLGALRAARIAVAQKPCVRLSLIVNRSPGGSVARVVAARFQAALGRFLSRDAEDLGHIAEDPRIADSCSKRWLVVERFPRSAPAKAIVAIAGRVLEPGADAVELRLVKALRVRPSDPVQEAA